MIDYRENQTFTGLPPRQRKGMLPRDLPKELKKHPEIIPLLPPSIKAHYGLLSETELAEFEKQKEERSKWSAEQWAEHSRKERAKWLLEHAAEYGGPIGRRRWLWKRAWVLFRYDLAEGLWILAAFLAMIDFGLFDHNCPVFGGIMLGMIISGAAFMVYHYTRRAIAEYPFKD